jgi:putative membrane protein
VLANYVQQLSDEFSGFKDGIGTYSRGVTTLAENYAGFETGLKQYLDGSQSLYGGISSLRNGTNELYINVQDLPETLQKEIDSFIDEYKGSNFELTSFVSDKNTTIERVQFIMVSDAIEIPEAAVEPIDETATEQSICDRLLALFRW